MLNKDFQNILSHSWKRIAVHMSLNNIQFNCDGFNKWLKKITYFYKIYNLILHSPYTYVFVPTLVTEFHSMYLCLHDIGRKQIIQVC
jgi:hypothetical protein